MLAWFRDRPNITWLGHGSGLSQAIAYHYLAEGIAVLSAQAPDLREALSLSHLIPDGTIIGCDRVRETKTSRNGKEIDAWYSGKTHDFGGLLQALMAPAGVPLWLSEVSPGSVHDITAARDLVLAALAPYLRHLPVLADGGYDGAGRGGYTPVKSPRTATDSPPTPARTTGCYEGCAASVNAASRYSPSAGPHCNTSCSALAASARSHARPSS